MFTDSRSSMVRAGVVFCITAIAMSIQPGAAKAQTRGTMQVSATVVDTRPAFAALDVARASAATGAQASSSTVATLAQVDIAPRRETAAPARPEPLPVVVTINYPKN